MIEPSTGRISVEDVVVVRLGETAVGVRIERVLEVVRVPRITRIPFPPPSVLGVVSVRGTVLAVIDLGARLLSSPSRTDGRLLLTTGNAGERVALLVDEVVGLTSFDERLEEAPPEVADSLPEGWVEAVLAPADGRPVALLDLDAVLAPERGT